MAATPECTCGGGFDVIPHEPFCAAVNSVHSDDEPMDDDLLEELLFEDGAS